jgi:hypothetical protein
MENITIIAAIAAIDVQIYLPIARWLSIGRKAKTSFGKEAGKCISGG